MTLEKAIELFKKEKMDLAFPTLKEYAEQGDSVAQWYLGYMYEYGKGVEQDYVKAVEWYTKSAEQGDSDAQWYLGYMYYVGKGVEQDYVKAFEWYTKAAEQGDSGAQWSLGDMYEDGKGVKQDYAKAFEWYTKAAEQGDSGAQWCLGDMYEDGKGVEQDYAKAAEWYTKSAEQGDSTGQCRLGYMYYDGKGVEQDYAKAVEWYTKAVEQGDADAQMRFAYMYEYGKGVEQDYTKAFEWYTKSANQDNSGAQWRLGQMFDFGNGVKQDYNEALEWYTKSAKQGNSTGQWRLGHMYEYGKGVEQDCTKALEWYTKSAEQGDSDAQWLLGDMYEYDRGIEQDYNKAFEWYTKSAKQGNSTGQWRLGQMYEHSKGVEQDYTKAFEWYTKSAEQDDSVGQWSLGCLYELGQGTIQNCVKAVELYSMSADQGDSQGQYNLARVLYFGIGIEKSKEKAIKLLRLSEAQDDNLAPWLLGIIYQLENDYDKSLECLKKALSEGYRYAAISIGDLYKDGLGVEQNGEKAREYYLQADDADGFDSLGNLYLQGCEGIEQDVETAYEYFKKAEAKGKDCSLSIEMCEKYLGITKDDSHGIREFADKIDAINSNTYDIVDNELRSDFGDIWDSLQDETKADLRTGLLEYTILYKLYKDKDVDFSAAISPITKAFEIVLARFFCRDFVKFLEDNNVNPSLYRRYPFLVDRETGKFHADTDSFTLGSFCNLIAGDKLLRQMERQQPMIKDAMRKGEIKYVSFDKKITSSVDKNVIAYVENILFKDAMTGATENYLLGLAQEVSFVSDIYRNPAMHKRKMGLAVAESCGDCLLKVKKIIYHFVEHIDFEKIKQESYKIKYDVDLVLGDKKIDVNKPALQVGDVIDLQITDVDDRHFGKFDKDGNTYNVVLQYRR